MTLSLIVTVYNGERYLPRFLESLTATLARVTSDKVFFEVVVVDDASADRTAEVLANYRLPTVSFARFVRLAHSENRGLGASRNTAMAAATGNWYAFADADDELMPEWAPRLSDALSAAKEVDALVFDARAEWEEGGRPGYDVVYGRSAGCVSGRAFAVDVLRARSVGARMWNKVLRRELFQGVDFVWREFEDYPVLAQILPQVRAVGVLSEKLYVYHRRADGLSQYTNPVGGAAALTACCEQAERTTDADIRVAMKVGVAIMIADFLVHVPKAACDRRKIRAFLRRQAIRLFLAFDVGWRVKVKCLVGCLK